MKWKILILSLLVLALQQVNAQVEVNRLRCELLVDPFGIDTKQPALSWEIVSDQRNVQQTAYHILVASTKENLDKNEGDLWNSGKRNSSQSAYIIYNGKPLASRTSCYWKIKTYTNKGESDWSQTAHWSMGLLDKTDWKAKWIGYDKASSWDSITQWSRLSARYFRKQFQSAENIKRATVYIVGLGLYELYINGKKISDHVLAPAPTDYRKSVLYNTFDVTANITKGENVVATVLGNGRFFTMRQDYKPQKINTFGYPKMLLQLEIEYKDGSKSIVASDETWKLNVDGPIRSNNEYDGEEYDATKEMPGWNATGFNENNWISPELVSPPPGKVVAQMTPPIKVSKTWIPRAMTTLADGRLILDMGQNFSGWIKFKLHGGAGRKITLRFAESLQSNGELYVANLRDAKVTDVYTMKGGSIEEWEPSFIYHGFRYVEVTNCPGMPVASNFEARLVSDEMETTGSFDCSDPTINKIHANAWWGITSNYKGMPVDCPQRNERQPWLGDRATGSGGEAFLFNNAALYTKWLDDIEESQTAEGAIPDVAPAFWNYYSDNMTWPGTYILVADMLHRQFGDSRPIAKHYPSMKKWMGYMRTQYMKDNILTKDKYGDWCVPPESLEIIRSKDSMRTTKGELIATAYYYQLLQYMKKFAKLAGKEADVKGYDELAVKIKTAFNKKFFNKEKGWYDNNTVTANLLPLYFGITPANLQSTVFANICQRIKNTDDMHISTGVIGTQWLMRGLTKFGNVDMAYALASNKSYPSWGYMVDNGATTIWELWNGNTASPQMNSQNHVMLLGDLLIWMYENLAGIKSSETSVAFKEIVMKPSFVDGINEVNASYQSQYGAIRSRWRQWGSDLLWSIRVPANAKAIIYIPASDIDKVTEGKNLATKSEGVKFLRKENGNMVFEIGSGIYSFTGKSSFLK
jgi:alpha-L-rhamnosidase